MSNVLASPTGPPRSLRPPARLETFLTEAENPGNVRFFEEAERLEKARCHNSDMHVIGEHTVP